MGSGKKDRAQARAQAKNQKESQSRGQSAARASFNQAQSYPFGAGGPCLKMTRRDRGVLVLGVQVLWTLFCLGMSLTSLQSTLGLFCGFNWVMQALFSMSVLVSSVAAPVWESSVWYWFLGMHHGSLWVALVAIPVYGVLPSHLWSSFGDSCEAPLRWVTCDLVLLSQLGDVVLLVLPLVFLLLYCYSEREFLTAIFYDKYTNYYPDYKETNWAYQLSSPAVPICFWYLCCCPRVLTDLPGWPGFVVVAACSALPNGLVGYFMLRRMNRFTGSVLWVKDGWLVWLKPVGGLASFDPTMFGNECAPQ